VIATLEHLDSKGRPKLVEECSYPVTAPGCVDVVATDLALFTRMPSGRFRLDEVARGFTVDEVLGLTDMRVDVADSVGVMQDAW
jgi:3-oxoacid CoA-transferase